MTTRMRSLSRTLIAVTAATAPVLALAPTAQAAPAPPVPRTPFPPALPTTPLPAVPLTPAADDHTAVTRWVSAPVANVRSGPDLSDRVVATKTAGTRVSGTLTPTGWLRISSTQYMHSSVLTSSNPAPSTSSSTTSSTVTMYIAATLGNVRSGPGLGYPVVTTMPLGAVARGTWTDGWLNLGNGRFVSGTILTAQAPSGGAATPASSVTQYVASRTGAVRSGPGLSYTVLTRLSQGTAVRGTWTNGWLDLGGGRFISRTVLTSQAPAAPAPVTSEVTRWVKEAVANVRSGPGTSYPITRTRTRGTEVRGTFTANGWLRISSNEYMARSVLTDVNPAPPPGASEVTRWVKEAVANVRSGPGTSYPITRTRTRGTEVRGTFTANGWLRISSNEYMARSVLTDVSPGGSTPTPVASVTQYVTSAMGNVRSGPGLDYSVVTRMPRGTEVRGTWTNGWLDLGGGRFISKSILSSTNPVTTAPSPLRSALMKTAAEYVGYPYVLYGTPPNAFDCSSYTWWVFKQHGITIPRTVRDQRTVVTKVTDPQPGDLVFYNNWYHVGIYAGNGMIYEAMNPSTGVVYHKMWDLDVWYGRVPGV